MADRKQESPKPGTLVLALGRHLSLDPQNVAITTAARTVDRSIMGDADRWRSAPADLFRV
ncbi:hypothetical protein [Streptomyces sp. NPDC086777]|uniref:hypothetical protein n=1 Tax=Streptomyces sp. NPDC086777 TaxID=3154866 RepID=UPI00344D9D9E